MQDKSKNLNDLHTKCLNEDGSLFLYENAENPTKPKSSQENLRKPLSVISEPDEFELEIEDSLPKPKFLNDHVIIILNSIYQF